MEHDGLAREVVAIATPTMHALAATGARLAVTDIGAADGTLLHQLMRLWPDELRESTDWRGIDLRDRPSDLDPAITWIAGDIVEVAARIEATPGLVVAHELLDDVPCDVVEPDNDGALRLVLVDPSSGHESIGSTPSH
jgi:SAM-dependent MidA family methyltransferase